MNGCVTYPLLGRNGRLGNCLFQSAATIGYAGENGKMYAFPEWEYAKHFKNFPQGAVPKEYKSIKEAGFYYEQLPFAEGDVGLDGYLQSEKYFKRFDGTVRSAFEFNDFLVDTSKILLKKDRDEQVNVAVHLRFGDYVGNSFYTQLWETEYYASAFFDFANQKNTYYIFSDDIAMAQREFNRMGIPENYYGKFFYVSGYSDIQDLCSMSLCDKIIMANSSFSWWGAWLGTKKHVIAPKEWFSKSAGLDTKDLYCEGWRVI